MRVITKKVFCPVTGKRSFPSELDARISLLRPNDDQLREKIPVRAFQCEHCNWWHTTSTGSKNEAGRENLTKRDQDTRSAFKKLLQASWPGKSAGEKSGTID